MFDLNLKCAKVIDIDDADKQGKIKISIESEFEDIDSDLLPWAVPLFSNLSNTSMEMHLPSINSIVWVLVDKYYKRFYYLPNRYFYKLFDFSKVSGLLDKCDKINTEYKNIDFKYYTDGTLLFHNNSDGSTGIITNTGTSIYIDEDGNLIKSIEGEETSNIKTNKKETIDGSYDLSVTKQATSSYENNFNLKCKKAVSISAMSTISVKSSTNAQVEIGNAINTLGSILTELCTDLSGLVTVGPTGSQTSPTLSAQMSVLLSKIKLVFK